jgi:hypothetical protein
MYLDVAAVEVDPPKKYSPINKLYENPTWHNNG